MSAPSPSAGDPVGPPNNVTPDRLARASRRSGGGNRTPALSLRQGAIVSAGSGTCTITIGGDSTPVPGVRHLASYSPTSGDSVFLAMNDDDVIVLGKLA